MEDRPGCFRLQTTSREARLTVSRDLQPPALVSAFGHHHEVRVSFSEPISTTSAQLLDNYTITNTLGQTRRITRAWLTNRQEVILFVEPPVQIGDVLRVRGITDLAQAGNVIPANAGMTIGFDGVVIPFDGVWKYSQPAADPGSAWSKSEFNDQNWTSGPGLLGEATVKLAEPLRTPLLTAADGGPVTTYFRRQFYLPAAFGQAPLLLRYYVDDGAVFHLNGHEIHRVGVDPGQASTNLSSRWVDEPGLEGPFQIEPGRLNAGTNLLAVEVHQVSSRNLDVVFGAEVALPSVPSVPVPVP